MSEIIIRKIQKEDLLSVTDIYNEAIMKGCYTGDMDPFTYGERTPWLNEHLTGKYAGIVAQKAEKIVGYGTLSPYRSGRRALDHVAEASIYVKHGYHGQGAGTAILKQLETQALNYEITIVVAYIFENNVASIHLFSAHGYTRWGELPGVVRQKNFTTGHVIYGKELDKRQREV